MARYEFTVEGNKVICTSYFAGLPVFGVAKCNPADNFILPFGKRLAMLRCDKKVSKKRLAKAKDRFKKAEKEFNIASKEFIRAMNYYEESKTKYEDDCSWLADEEYYLNHLNHQKNNR